MRIGHVHLKVEDLDEAVDFYRGLLDLEVEEKHGSYVFLSRGEDHHTVALQAVGGRRVSSGDRPGLYHVAFEVENESKLAELDRRVRERGLEPSAVDHGISRSIYFEDPSGNGIEVYVDTRDETGRRQWKGKTEPLSFS